MKHLLHIGLLCLGIVLSNYSLGYAQQLPQLSQNYHNPFFLNPAYANHPSAATLAAVVRTQWLGLPNNPLLQNVNTQVVAAQLPMPAWHTHIGLTLANDNIGAIRNTTATLAAAYQQSLGTQKTLSIGIAAQMVNGSLNGSKLRSPEGNYENGLLDHQDAYIPQEVTTNTAFDGGIGIRFQTPKLDVGIALNKLLGSTLDYTFDTGSATQTFKRYYQANAAYRLELNHRIALTPTIWFKTDLVAYQIDSHLLVDIDQIYKAGIGVRGFSARSLDAIVAMVGMQINPKFRVAYSYDYHLTLLRRVQTGSHEISLLYALPNLLPTQKGKKTYSPRFL